MAGGNRRLPSSPLSRKKGGRMQRVEIDIKVEAVVSCRADDKNNTHTHTTKQRSESSAAVIAHIHSADRYRVLKK